MIVRQQIRVWQGWWIGPSDKYGEKGTHDATRISITENTNNKSALDERATKHWRFLWKMSGVLFLKNEKG